MTRSIFVSIAVCAALAACGGKARDGGLPSGRGAGAAPAGFWRVLVQPNATWRLAEISGGDDEPTEIVVETVEVRRVGDAEVARLRWTHRFPGGEADAADQGLPGQVAVTPAGVWFLGGDLDDERVAAALAANPPSQPDPPVEVKRQSRADGDYVTLRATREGERVVCVGEEPGPGSGDCDDICHAELCVAERGGVVSVEGLWAPGEAIFVQKGYE